MNAYNEILAFSTILIPIVSALVAAFKSMFSLACSPNKRFIPIVAIVIGIVVGLVSEPLVTLPLTYRLWAGGLAGLGSMGLLDIAEKQRGQL